MQSFLEQTTSMHSAGKRDQSWIFLSSVLLQFGFFSPFVKADAESIRCRRRHPREGGHTSFYFFPFLFPDRKGVAAGRRDDAPREEKGKRGGSPPPDRQTVKQPTTALLFGRTDGRTNGGEKEEEEEEEERKGGEARAGLVLDMQAIVCCRAVGGRTRKSKKVLALKEHVYKVRVQLSKTLWFFLAYFIYLCDACLFL